MTFTVATIMATVKQRITLDVDTDVMSNLQIGCANARGGTKMGV